MSPRKGESREDFLARRRLMDRANYPKPNLWRPDAWFSAVRQVAIKDGCVIIGSDMHYWPGKPRTTAHSAMVRLCKEMLPTAIIVNGDVLDLPKIGKHPSIGWEERPEVSDEIEIGKTRLSEIAEAAPNARRLWNAGNHDLRFESTFAAQAPNYTRVHGVHLKDHFPNWEPAWLTEINESVMVKHRWKGGTTATLRNVIECGRSIVTGHLHNAQVTCWNDYDGVRYGVDTGTLAIPFSEAFIDYTEANSVNWRSAVTVLTFYNWKLLLPEQLHVFDEGQRLTMFRGQVQQEAE